MLSHNEIKEKCFIGGQRFLKSVKELKDRHPEANFEEILQDSLSQIIKIAEKPQPNGALFKSKSYKMEFEEQTGIKLEKSNPFNFVLFSDSLSINMIFILIEEYKRQGYTKSILRDYSNLTDKHIVCAFDLFDEYNGESLFRVRTRR